MQYKFCEKAAEKNSNRVNQTYFYRMHLHAGRLFV